MSVVQLFNREGLKQEGIDAINAEHRDAFKDAIIAYGWFYPMVEFCGTLTAAALLAWGGFQVRSGELTLGILVAFFQYGIRFFKPIQDLKRRSTTFCNPLPRRRNGFFNCSTRRSKFSPAGRRTGCRRGGRPRAGRSGPAGRAGQGDRLAVQVDPRATTCR